MSSTVTVIDPANRTGKVQVPLRYVVPTEEGVAVSMCMLYQKGRCRAGAQCRQVHADRPYVARLREKASSSCSCCAEHGDCRAVEPEFRRYLISDCQITVAGVNCGPLPVRRFGRTDALEQLLASSSGATLRVSEAKLCRLHKEDKCRFGKDCKNFHVCREVLGGVVSPKPTAALTASALQSRGGRYSYAASSGSSDHGMSSCPTSPYYSECTAPPSPAESCSSVSSSLSERRSSLGSNPTLTIDTAMPCEEDWCTQPPTPREKEGVFEAPICAEPVKAGFDGVHSEAFAALAVFSAVMRGSSTGLYQLW